MQYSLSKLRLAVVALAVAAAVQLSTTSAAESATCGNGLLEDGESCDTCAADCAVQPCMPQGKPQKFVVSFMPAQAMPTSSVSLLVSYRSSHVTVPGTGADARVKAQVTNIAPGTSTVANDLDYALRVVMSHPDQIKAGPLFTVAVDGCKGTPPSSAADFACTVVGCASSAGDIKGCTCSVAAK